MNRRVLPHRNLTEAERNARYRASESYRQREAAKRLPDGIKTEERITWAEQRVRDAQERLRANPNDAAWQAAVRAREAELRQLQRVQSGT